MKTFNISQQVHMFYLEHIILLKLEVLIRIKNPHNARVKS